MKPSEIVRHLNQHVIGQEEAKRILAVAVYTHFKRTAQTKSDAVELVKSNILLIGPTGTGKTLALRDAGTHPRCAVRDGRCDDAGAERICRRGKSRPSCNA